MIPNSIPCRINRINQQIQIHYPAKKIKKNSREHFTQTQMVWLKKGLFSHTNTISCLKSPSSKWALTQTHILHNIAWLNLVHMVVLSFFIRWCQLVRTILSSLAIPLKSKVDIRVAIYMLSKDKWIWLYSAIVFFGGGRSALPLTTILNISFY